MGLAAAFVILFAMTRRIRLLGVASALAILLLLFPSPILSRMKTIGDPHDPTAQDRLDFWWAGAQMVKDHPWLGVGPGHVRLLYSSYRHPEARRPSIGHLHSNVVHLAAERGLLGLTAWLWIWVAFLSRATRIYFGLPRSAEKSRAVVAGGLAASVAFFIAGLFEYNFGDSEVQMLLWVVMAIPFAVERWTADDLPT
jgi:O-antigen ligase